MKTQIQKFPIFIVLGTLASLYDADALNVFPIATNPAVAEFGGGTAFDGTNYFVMMLAGTNLVGQLFSTNGALIGSPINIGCNPGMPPSAALAFGQCNYLAAWSDNSISSGVDLFGQFISRRGAKIGSAFNLLSAQGGHGFQSVKALASDGTNFLVVWQDNNDGSLYGQMITPAGTLAGAEFTISNQPQNGTFAAATFGKTNYLVAWMSNNGVIGNTNRTYSEFVSANGTAGSPFQISQTVSIDQSALTAAFDGTNYFVVWPWNPGLPTLVTVTNRDLRGRLVSQTGTFPGNELGLTTDAGSEVFPSLAFDGIGYLLAWGRHQYESDLSLNPTNSNIFFRFFDSSGISTGPAFAVFTPQGTNTPILAINGLIFDGGRFAVAGSLGTIATTNGNIASFPSGEVFGAFIPRTPRFAAVYSFTPVPPNAITNSDGGYPVGGLTLSGSTLYGTGAGAGPGGSGVVFKVNTNGSGYTVLHAFSTFGPFYETNSDGASPQGTLILSGNTLYGTTLYGGIAGKGTVFKVNTNGSGFSVLHTFTALDQLGNNTDGANPYGGLVLGGSTLYGMAYSGGNAGNGVVFKININGTGFTNLHSFNGPGPNNDGNFPVGGLTLSGGTLFGTTVGGGSRGNGVVFKLNTNGTGYLTLHSFTASPTNNDGASPVATLILSGSTLYGTTEAGGSAGYGTVFKINTNGSGYKTLYSFGAHDLSFFTNSDGSAPYGALVLSGDTLYGTAERGGSAGSGTVFAIDTNGITFMVLHTFTAPNQFFTNSDGTFPESELIISDDALYGTANNGGAMAVGSLFSLSFSPAAITPIAPPQLTITRSGANVLLTWPASVTGFTLQSNANLLAPSSWNTVSPPPIVVNGQNTVNNSISSGQMFYRLIQ